MMPIQQFREAVYQSIIKRGDAFLDLLDALTVAGHVESPVALSEEQPFRRKFSSIFDTLLACEFDFDQRMNSLHCHQPADSETIAGYQVYAVDSTPNERPEAETLEDRSSLKTQKNEPVRYGHKYSWVARLIHWGSSWVAPVDVQRVEIALTDNQVAAIQVQELDAHNKQPKVIVADSLYGNAIFLAVFLLVNTVVALVWVWGNSVFYERPQPRQTGQRGAPAKHGARFKLAAPSRPADRCETFLLGLQTVVLTAWHGLHLKKLSELVGVVLRVQFVRADGTPRYQRPMWLFCTGPETVALKDLCCMYLWRFAIEHFFRFAKQHLGLNANQSTQTVSTDHWMWLCALAFWQLLLMREGVDMPAPAWYPQAAKREPTQRTPGQVQRGAFRYLLQLGSPARSPRPAGKGKGRSIGVQPAPRRRFPVVKKAKMALDRASPGP